jgi:hypothetical protein
MASGHESGQLMKPRSPSPFRFRGIGAMIRQTGPGTGDSMTKGGFFAAALTTGAALVVLVLAGFAFVLLSAIYAGIAAGIAVVAVMVIGAASGWSPAEEGLGLIGPSPSGRSRPPGSASSGSTSRSCSCSPRSCSGFRPSRSASPPPR